MFSQTIQDIISQINIQRIKSKDSTKTNQTNQRNLSRHLNNQTDISTSTKSISPDYQRSSNFNFNSNQRSNHSKSKNYRKKWTKKEQQLLCNLIGRYGSDFTFLQTQFPNKTRKQLKKKYQQIHKNKQYLNKIERIQQSIIRQRRKSLFDDQIMDIDEIQDKPKDQERSNGANRNIKANYHDIQQESQSY